MNIEYYTRDKENFNHDSIHVRVVKLMHSISGVIVESI